MLITLELHGNSLSHFDYLSMSPFLMDNGLLSIISAGCGQLVKMLITLEPHEVFKANVAYLLTLTLAGHWLC